MPSGVHQHTELPGTQPQLRNTRSWRWSCAIHQPLTSHHIAVLNLADPFSIAVFVFWKHRHVNFAARLRRPFLVSPPECNRRSALQALLRLAKPYALISLSVLESSTRSFRSCLSILPLLQLHSTPCRHAEYQRSQCTVSTAGIVIHLRLDLHNVGQLSRAHALLHATGSCSSSASTIVKFELQLIDSQSYRCRWCRMGVPDTLQATIFSCQPRHIVPPREP